MTSPTDLLLAVAPLAWLVVTLFAMGHALLRKRDPRASLSWIAFCLILPFGGPLLYFLFGINRIRTRARRLRRPQPREGARGSEIEADARRSGQHLPPALSELCEVARIADKLTHHPLLAGNALAPLHNGEQAYPRMLAAIEQAQHCVMLASYIFEANRSGQQFADALKRAQTRGVQVRVLLDGVSDAFQWPSASRMLESTGLKHARFNPLSLLPPSLHMNLRNHRKLMVVDGQVGYTGGMNIGDSYLAEDLGNPHRVVDLHFELRGPIVQQLAEVFLDDWTYACGERWNPPLLDSHSEPQGAVCRVIIDGPNEDLGNLTLVLIQAISDANHRVCIMTPYFLPPRELITALQAAALRGVDVCVILPQRSDNRIVDWATRNLLWQVLHRGVKVLYRPMPFAHTKLFIVDDHYAHIGSANLDPRSLRLNFEMAVEIYNGAFVQQLVKHFDETCAKSKPCTPKSLAARPLWVRIRDAVCWLFSPYL